MERKEVGLAFYQPGSGAIAHSDHFLGPRGPLRTKFYTQKCINVRQNSVHWLKFARIWNKDLDFHFVFLQLELMQFSVGQSCDGAQFGPVHLPDPLPLTLDQVCTCSSRICGWLGRAATVKGKSFEEKMLLQLLDRNQHPHSAGSSSPSSNLTLFNHYQHHGAVLLAD